MGKFDAKWLEGLIYHYAEKKMIEKNGRKTLHAIPMTRPLKEEDILTRPDGSLAFADYGDKVVIVTKDGRKYTVSKSGGKKEEFKKEDPLKDPKK